MASSSSSTPKRIRKINDALYEFHRPEVGYVDLEIVFVHGFQHEDAYRQTWMLADDSECWLGTWLAEKFPQSRIMSASYDSAIHVSASEGRMDMYLIGEYLAQSIIKLGKVGQSCPVVLVGHSVGGLVLKEVCIRAEQLGAKKKYTGLNPYTSFLTNMRGVFLFSTPASGSRVFGVNVGEGGPLLQYVELLSKEAARLNSDFADLRHKHGWKTFGVMETSVTIASNHDFRPKEGSLKDSTSLGVLSYYKHPDPSTPVVEEGAARNDVDNFCALSGEDHVTVCKPRDRESNNFLLLVNFVEKILDTEEEERRQWHSTLHMPETLVYSVSVDLVIKALRLEEERPSRISLVGMGGIGKSTIAKQVLIRVSSQFEYFCFVEDFQVMLRGHNSAQLRLQLLQTLVGDNLYHGSGRKVCLPDGGAQSIWSLLKGKKALVILDDVDSEEQISPLLKSGWCGRGSRLIITSRIQSRAMMPTFTMWEVPIMYMEEAKKLLYAHLDIEVIRRIPEELIEKVLVKCEGLPLAVEVIGSYLRFRRAVNFWNGALEKLTKAEALDGTKNDKLWAKLKVSYDDLEPPEREMFLDLAVFHKWDPNTEQYTLSCWKAMWKFGVNASTVECVLSNLLDRSFIKFRGTTRIYMHEQLRDLGKSIARPSFARVEQCRRIWRWEDVQHLLTDYKGDDARTEILVVDQNAAPPASDDQRKYCLSSVGRLQELRLLRMSHLTLTDGNSGSSGQRFPPNLASLDMISCSRSAPTPNSFWSYVYTPLFRLLESVSWPVREGDMGSLHRLTVLVLDNCDPLCLPNNFHELSNLTVLSICGEQLKILPRDFGLLPALQFLCLKNVGLSSLPDSIWTLPSLRSFKLSGCANLKTWPSIPAGESAQSTPLRKLLRLKLEKLPALTDLPESLGLIESLSVLDIIRCSALRKLPQSFGKVRNVEILEISDCGRLEVLCESFGELEALRDLCIHNCKQLKCLPTSLGDLQSLRYLSLNGLQSLSSLPESIGQLNKLKYIKLEEMSNLQMLPTTIRQLDPRLMFSIVNCSILRLEFEGMSKFLDTPGNRRRKEGPDIECALCLLMAPSYESLKAMGQEVLQSIYCASVEAYNEQLEISVRLRSTTFNMWRSLLTRHGWNRYQCHSDWDDPDEVEDWTDPDDMEDCPFYIDRNLVSVRRGVDPRSSRSQVLCKVRLGRSQTKWKTGLKEEVDFELLNSGYERFANPICTIAVTDPGDCFTGKIEIQNGYDVMCLYLY